MQAGYAGKRIGSPGVLPCSMGGSFEQRSFTQHPFAVASPAPPLYSVNSAAGSLPQTASGEGPVGGEALLTIDQHSSRTER